MRATTFLRALSGQATKPASADTSTLRLLQSQPAHYIVAQLHARKYLLTPNDTLLVPRLPQLQVGDKIELNRVLELGSRNYSLKPGQSSTTAADAGAGSSSSTSPSYLGPDIIQAHAQVVEHCKSELVRKERFKRRKRYHRIVHSKPAFTRLKILDFVIGGKAMGPSHIAQQSSVPQNRVAPAA